MTARERLAASLSIRRGLGNKAGAGRGGANFVRRKNAGWGAADSTGVARPLASAAIGTSGTLRSHFAAPSAVRMRAASHVRAGWCGWVQIPQAATMLAMSSVGRRPARNMSSIATPAMIA